MCIRVDLLEFELFMIVMYLLCLICIDMFCSVCIMSFLVIW